MAKMTIDKDKMKGNWRNTLSPIIFVLVLVGLYFVFDSSQTDPEEISFSTLVEQVKNEEVEKITVDGNSLEIELKAEDGEDPVLQAAQKEEEASLSETLVNYGIEPEVINAVDIEVKDLSGSRFWLGTVLPFLIPFALIAVFIWFMFGRVQNGNKKAMNFGQVQSRDTAPKKQKTTFKDIAGAKEAKEELTEIVDFLKHPGKFLALGAKIPKGVLLMGPPGTGKTLLARAVAGEAKVPFFHISGSEFVEMFVGVGASRVRDLFKKAKKGAPAIIFIDEIDAVGRQRGSGLGGSHDEREQTLNQILVEMDGFEPHDSVIIIAATNRPDVLDPALLRPGRFDRRVVLDAPDLEDRVAILKVHAKKKPLTKAVDLRILAQRTPGFSGADLENLLNEAAILAARRDDKVITADDCYEAIEKVMLGPERKSRIFTDEEKKLTAYHEGGHALVAHLLPDADPVHKISIISRGRAGGYTLKIPDADRRYESKTQFEADLAVALGGFVAEEMIFGQVTTGPSSDLKSASEIARKIVTAYGMSEKLGPVTFGGSDEMVFLGKEIHDNKNYSEQTSQVIDSEVKRLIDEAMALAKKVLTENRDKLDLIANTLLEREVLEKDEFDLLMDGKDLPPKKNSFKEEAEEKSKKKAKADSKEEKDSAEAEDHMPKDIAPEGGMASQAK